MRIYTVHASPSGIGLSNTWPAQFIPEGFSWPAFLFAPFWAFAHGLMLDGVVILAGSGIALALAHFVSVSIGAVLGVLLLAVFATIAHDRQRRYLKMRGVVQLGVISAPNRLLAAHRWIDRHPGAGASLI